MSGLGDQLCAAREQRKVTAAQAARQLYVRVEFVTAMDSEDWARLGPPIYARGFVRNYAKLVGIDPASIADQIDAAIPAQGPDVLAARATQMQAPDVSPVIEPEPITFRMHHGEQSRPGYGWLLGGAYVLAAVLVIAVLYYTFAPAPREQAQSTAQSAQAQTQPDAGVSPAPQDDAIFSGGSAGAANGAKQNGVDLQLQLTQDSWLSVTVDGKRVVYQTLPAGTVRDFHGVHEITLRAGNAGGVNARIDGKPLGSLGQIGQVEERKFAANHPSQTGPRE